MVLSVTSSVSAVLTGLKAAYGPALVGCVRKRIFAVCRRGNAKLCGKLPYEVSIISEAAVFGNFADFHIRIGQKLLRDLETVMQEIFHAGA